MQLTREYIMKHRTARGAWTRAQIEAIGLEKYYQGLSKAIADAGDGFITDFSYTWSEE